MIVYGVEILTSPCRSIVSKNLNHQDYLINFHTIETNGMVKPSYFGQNDIALLIYDAKKIISMMTLNKMAKTIRSYAHYPIPIVTV